MDVFGKQTDLTHRERDILRLLAHGLSDAEIAEALFLTVGTVKWYNRQIYSKLGVQNRTQAAAYAQQSPADTPIPANLAELPKHNLPAQVTSFIGRKGELLELRQLLQNIRLLTLSGPPGTGKTRLALEFAASVMSVYEDGVYFVSLAPLGDSSLVLNAIAQALNVAEMGNQPLLGSLKQFLQSKHLLLILDNFEHILPAAPLVSDLLHAASRLSILVTSREVLRLYGEHEFSVSPLSLPNLKDETSADKVGDYEAVELFVQRARAVSPIFSLSEDNAASVAGICVQVDGLPLAIELAAARAKFYNPQSLLVRLSSRLDTLSYGPQDLPTRQKTLRSTLAWSYDLLDPDEKTLFARLGIFAGGWTIESAQAVCGHDLTLDIVDGLESLLNKSLLRQVEGFEGEPRFMMLETMREYALAKLDENREMASLSGNHAEFFLQMVETAAAEIRGPNESRWFSRLESEHDNVRAALQWTLTQDNPMQMTLRFIAGLARFWDLRGHFSEGRAWLKAALSLRHSAMPTLYRADALQGISELAYDQCDYTTTETLAAEALAIYRDLGDKKGIANALLTLGNVATEVGNYDIAPALFEEAYHIMRELGDPRGSGRALTLLGWGAMRPGDYEQARLWLEEALALSRENGHQAGIAFVYSGLGEVALRQGKLDIAFRYLEDSLTLRRELGDKWGTAASLGSLGWVALLQGDYERTAALLLESFTMRKDHHDSGGMAWCLEKFAEMSYLQGDPARATQLYGAAAALRASVNSVIDPADQPHYEAIIAEIRAGIGDHRFDTLWSQGQSLTLDQITDLLS